MANQVQVLWGCRMKGNLIYRAKRLSAKNTHEEIWILNTITTLFSFVKQNYM